MDKVHFFVYSVNIETTRGDSVAKSIWETHQKFLSWELWRLNDASYLACADDHSWSLVVDPVFGLNTEQKKLVASRCNETTRRIAWASHPHHDHFSGTAAWQSFGFEVTVSQEFAELMAKVSPMSRSELSKFVFGTAKAGFGSSMILSPLAHAIGQFSVDHVVSDGPMIAGLPFEVRSFAGHSPSDSMLVSDECVFSGDIAFIEEGEFLPANCDLPLSNRKQYWEGEICEFLELARSHQEAVFCPGHCEMFLGKEFLSALGRFLEEEPEDT